MDGEDSTVKDIVNARNVGQTVPDRVRFCSLRVKQYGAFLPICRNSETNYDSNDSTVDLVPFPQSEAILVIR